MLREDVKASNKAAFYEQLLDKINTIQYAKDKAFKAKKRRRRKRVYETRKQLLREFDVWEWNSPRIKLTDEERQLFQRVELWGPKKKYVVIRYVFTEPWRYVLQVRPHMITHIKMTDNLLEGRIRQLDNYISNNYLNHKIIKMVRGRNQSRHWGDDERYRDPNRNKTLLTILDECRREE